MDVAIWTAPKRHVQEDVMRPTHHIERFFSMWTELGLDYRVWKSPTQRGALCPPWNKVTATTVLCILRDLDVPP